MNWKQLFPQFEPELIEVIEKEAVQRSFNAGDIIMRTGQYIKSTALVLEGQIKIYRENIPAKSWRKQKKIQKC